MPPAPPPAAQQPQQPAAKPRFKGVRARGAHTYGMQLNMCQMDPVVNLSVGGWPSPADAAIAWDLARIWRGLQQRADLAALDLNLPLQLYEQQPQVMEYLRGASFEELKVGLRQSVQEVAGKREGGRGRPAKQRRSGTAAAAAAGPAAAAAEKEKEGGRSQGAGLLHDGGGAILQEDGADAEEPGARAAGSGGAAAVGPGARLSPLLLGGLRSETAAIKTVAAVGRAQHAQRPARVGAGAGARRRAAAVGWKRKFDTGDDTGDESGEEEEGVGGEDEDETSDWEWRPPGGEPSSSEPLPSTSVEQLGRGWLDGDEEASGAPQHGYRGVEGPLPEDGLFEAFIHRSRQKKRKPVGRYSSAAKAAVARDVATVWARQQHEQKPGGKSPFSKPRFNFPQLELGGRVELLAALAPISKPRDLRKFLVPWVARHWPALAQELGLQAASSGASGPGGGARRPQRPAAGASSGGAQERAGKRGRPGGGLQGEDGEPAAAAPSVAQSSGQQQQRQQQPAKAPPGQPATMTALLAKLSALQHAKQRPAQPTPAAGAQGGAELSSRAQVPTPQQRQQQAEDQGKGPGMMVIDLTEVEEEEQAGLPGQTPGDQPLGGSAHAAAGVPARGWGGAGAFQAAAGGPTAVNPGQLLSELRKALLSAGVAVPLVVKFIPAFMRAEAGAQGEVHRAIMGASERGDAGAMAEEAELLVQAQMLA